MMLWTDLREVWITTTALGPFTDDMFITLSGPSGDCVIPSESLGAESLTERLTQLPGFNEEAYFAAMGPTENARFCVWRRSDSPPPAEETAATMAEPRGEEGACDPVP